MVLKREFVLIFLVAFIIALLKHRHELEKEKKNSLCHFIFHNKEYIFLNLTIAFNPGINKLILSMSNFGNNLHDFLK